MPSFRHLAQGALSVVIALIVAEGGLRVTSKRFNASLYTTDATRGFALRPHAQGWSVDEGENFVRINSDGLRDREHAIARPANTLRIAVLGDSATEARQVPLDKTYVALVEHRLRTCAALRPRDVETINFAVPGYSLAQQYRTLEDHVWPYHPQVVMVALYLGNAILNSSRALNPLHTPGIPFYTPASNGAEPDALSRTPLAFNRNEAQWRNRFSDMVNALRTLGLANDARTALSTRLAALFPPTRAATLPPDYMAVWPYLEPRNPDMQQAWQVSEALLRMMRDSARAHSVAFWIVTLTMPLQVEPDPAKREAFQSRIGAPDLFYPDRRIAAFAAAENIPHITLAPAMSQYATEHRTYLHGFFNTPPNTGHWNETGHALAAQLISDKLCSAMPGP